MGAGFERWVLWLACDGEDVLNIEVSMLSSLATVMKNRRWTTWDRSLCWYLLVLSTPFT